MWISSFVVTLAADGNTAPPALRALEGVPVFTLGERHGSRLPVVMEVADGSAARRWHEWVQQLPGVLQVDVAFISFDDQDHAENGVSSDDAAPNHPR